MTVTDSAPAAAGDSPQSIRLTPLPAATPPPTLSSQPDRVPIPLRNFARRTPPADMPRGARNNKKKKEEAAAKKVSHTDSRISTAPALSASCSTKGRGDDKIQTNGSLTFPLLSTSRCAVACCLCVHRPQGRPVPSPPPAARFGFNTHTRTHTSERCTDPSSVTLPWLLNPLL